MMAMVNTNLGDFRKNGGNSFRFQTISMEEIVMGDLSMQED